MNAPFILPLININENKEKVQEEKNHKIGHEKNKKIEYGKGVEARAIKEEIGDFEIDKSEAYKKIISQFGRSIRFNELLGIINSIRIFLKIKHDIVLPETTRNEKRNFQLLIKFIERNNELIFPYLPYVSLCDSSFQKILLDV